MGGNTVNFGSRAQFLPGDGSNEIDIKYQRYGGCFVTYKKGFFYVLASLILAAISGYLVYYYFGCRAHNPTVSSNFNINCKMISNIEIRLITVHNIEL